MSTMEYAMIKDIRPGQKNINVVFIILEVGHPTITKDNREVRTFKVADSTAAINVSIWDEPGQQLMSGDIVRLTKGYASVWRQCLTLYAGKNGDLHKIGEFCMVFNEQLNMSEPNPALAAQMVAGNNSANNANNSIGPPVRYSSAGQGKATETTTSTTTNNTTSASGKGGNNGGSGSGSAAQTPTTTAAATTASTTTSTPASTSSTSGSSSAGGGKAPSAAKSGPRGRTSYARNGNRSERR